MQQTRRERRLKLAATACHAFMNCKWHWFKYHFSRLPLHPFAHEMMEAIIDCDERIDGFGEDLLGSIVAIRDKNKDHDHYDQLMQRMAELLVIRQALLIECDNPTYFVEPTAGESKKRPDLLIRADNTTIAIEIKAPSCIKQKSLRKSDTFQILARLPGDPKKLGRNLDVDVVLPRDNAVKDFLISADEKFASFKAEGDCLGVLVIVWDDFMQEVITALSHEESGLLTPKSFARDTNGNPLPYANVDAVIVIRHLPYFMNGAGDGDLMDRQGAFDFGNEASLPNIYVVNTNSKKTLPDSIKRCFRAYPLDDERILKLADYRAQEMIFWLDI